MESSMSVKGQVTIPKEARDYLKLNPGDTVKFFKHPDGHIVILPTLSVKVLKGMVPLRRATPATLEEMEKASGPEVVPVERQELLAS